jgi:hypothetical protein
MRRVLPAMPAIFAWKEEPRTSTGVLARKAPAANLGPKAVDLSSLSARHH